WKYSPSKSFVLNFNWILLSLTLRAFITPLPRSNVTFCAGPSVSTTVSGDGDIALGSIIVPLHVNCRASSANAAILKKAMISGAIMLVRNIDKAHLSSDAELELRDPLAPILKRPETAYIPEIEGKRKLKTAPVRPGAALRSARALLLGKAGETARCAQHAAGNFDNRHVEIVCAASARVNVSVLYQALTAPTGLALLGCSRRAPFGRAARGSVAPRKMACRLAREGKHSQRFKA